MSIFNAVAGRRSGNPLGVCFHNDTGSGQANISFYEGWLPNHSPESGFAHAYVAEDGVLIAEDLINKAWHCGDSYGNANFLSIEICQSMGDETIFRENEQKALDLAADWFRFYGWYFISELKKRLEEPVDERGVEKMNCLYTVKDTGKVYWFDGRKVHYLTHPDQITILNRIYNDCFGKDMPSYIFENSAPWHIRLIQATCGEEMKA